MLNVWKLTVLTAILGFFTACPSPPKAPSKITPLGTTLPPASIQRTVAGATLTTGSNPIAPPVATEPPVIVHTTAAPGAQLAPQVQQNQWLSLERWSRSNGLEAPRRFDNGWGPTFQSRSSNGVLSITMGSRVAYWNGLALSLGFVPHLTNGLPFLHALDLIKNVAR